MKTTLINYRTYNLDRSKVTPIDRQSIFGNPFYIGEAADEDGTREEVIAKYRYWFETRIDSDSKFEEAVRQLKGKTLGCWCRPEDGFKGRLLCHGQIIIAYLEGCKPEEVE